MAQLYKDSNEAEREVRQTGQGLSLGRPYKPGDFYREATGEDYVVGSIANKRLGIPQPPAVNAPPAGQPAARASVEDDVAVALKNLAATETKGASVDEDIAYILGKNPALASPQKPAEPQSDGTLLGDLGRSLARGGVALGGGVYELGNIATLGGLDSVTQGAFGTSGTQALAGARQSLNKQDSPELQRQRAELEKAEGFWSSFGTVLTNPRLLGTMALEMVPQVATVAVAAKTVATRVFASEFAKQTAANVAKADAVAAANAAASRAATYTVMGVNPALEAGMAGSDVRTDVMTMAEAELNKSPQYQSLVQQFGDNEQGRALARARLANDAATTAALVTAPISAAATFLLGGVESDIAKSAVGKIAAEATGIAEKRGLKQIGLGIVKGGTKEAGQEGIEEGGSQFGQNVGAVFSGADPDRPLSQGVGQAAGAGAALGLVAGAAGNVRLPTSEAAPASPETPGNTSGTTETRSPAGDPSNQSAEGTSNITMSDEEFGRTMESPKITPVLAALYYEAGSQVDMDADGNPIQRQPGEPTMQQTQIQQLALQYNPTIDLAKIIDDNPDIVSQGNDILATSPQGFVQMFRNSIPEQVSKPSQKPLAPPTDEMSQGDEVFSEPDSADAALASAEDLGIAPKGQPGAPIDNQVGAPDLSQVPTTPLGQPANQSTGQASPFVTFKQELVDYAKTRDSAAKDTDYVEVPVPQEIKAIGDALGIPIFGYKYTGKSRKLQLHKGLSTASGIGINVNAKGAHLNVLGHEVYHDLAMRDPAAAAQLTGLIQQYISEEGRKKYNDWLKTTDYDPSEFNEEMAADVLGVLFTDPQFWSEVNAQSETLLEKVLNTITGIINRLKSSISKDEMYTKRGRAMQGFIKDYDGVRKMLAQFVADNAKKPRAEMAAQPMADFDPLEQATQFAREGKKAYAARVYRSADLFKTTGVPFEQFYNQAQTATPVEAATPQQFKSARFADNSYEVSSQGDKRFSAFNARLSDGRTIEEAYQLDVKGYRQQGGTSWRDGKGKPPVNGKTNDQLYADYLALWQQWARENPGLVEELRQAAAGKTLTDKFATGPVNQARALADVLNGNIGTPVTAPALQQTVAKPVASATENTTKKTAVPNKGTIVPKEDTNVLKTGTPPEVQTLPNGRVILRTNFQSPNALTPEQDKRRADLYARASAVNVAGTINSSQMAQIDKILGFDGKFTVPQVAKFDLVEEILAKPEADMAASQERVAAQGVTDEQLQQVRDNQIKKTEAPADSPFKGLDMTRNEILSEANSLMAQGKLSDAEMYKIEMLVVAAQPNNQVNMSQILQAQNIVRQAQGRPQVEATTGNMANYSEYLKERKEAIEARRKELDKIRETLNKYGVQKSRLVYTAEEEGKGKQEPPKSFAGRAQFILNQMFSPAKANARIAELEQILKSFGKGRIEDVRQSDAEYIFSHFAQVGAITGNEADELRRSDDRRERLTTLKTAIDQLRGRDLNDRAEAARLNVSAIAEELADLRSEMEAAGVAEAEIDRILLDKEAGVDALINGLFLNESPQVAGLATEMANAGADAATVRFSAEQRALELGQFQEQINRLRDSLIQAGVPIEQVDRTLSTVREVQEVNEPAATQADLFGDQSVVAAQIVDAALKGGDEVKNPRSFATLLTEAKYAKVGTLDILNELRLRNINVKANIESSIMRPGVMYPLEYWLKKPSNEGRDPFVLRQEWLASLDSGIRDVEDFPAAKNAILNDLSAGEKLIYDQWKKDLDQMRDRLKKGGSRDDQGRFVFNTLDDAFPNALFNKHPLSVMRQEDRLSDEDRTILRYLTSDTDKSLADVWFEDLNYAWSSRPDLRTEIEDLVSEKEMVEFQRWRKAKVREEVAPELGDVRSRAIRAVLSMRQSGSMMDAETYSRFINDVVEKIHAANLNEIRPIIQNAYELLESARAGDSDGVMDNIENVDMASQDAAITETDEDFSFEETADETTDEGAEEETVGEMALFTSDTMPIPGSKIKVDPEIGDANADPAKIYGQMRLRSDVRNMRGPVSGVALNATITDHINGIILKWKGAPSVTVYENLGQLTEEERQYIEAKAGSQRVKGVMMPDGRVYLFSDAMESVEDAEFTLFHETYGHRGLRAFLGDKLNSFLENQYRLNKTVREAADALMAKAKETGRGMTTVEATEEVLADMAVTNKEPGLFSQIIRALQKFMRSIGMDNVADWMESKSQADLAFVLSQARKAVREGTISPMNGAPSEIRFNAEPVPIEVYATNELGRTTAYAVYNPFTHNWTVFYNKAGLDAKNFGIQVFADYAEALKFTKTFGKTIRVKDNPTRMDKTPGSFIKKPVPKFWDVKGIKKWARMAQITIFSKYKPIYDVVKYLKSQGIEVDLDKTLKLYAGRLKPYFDNFRMKMLKPLAASLNKIKDSNFSYTFRDDNGVDMEYKNSDLVGLYLTALHAPERNAEVAARTKKDGKPTNIKGSGILDSEARDILKDLQQSPVAAELAAISEMMQKISEQKINYALMTGLINEHAARNMSEAYDFYVNLSGNKDESSIEFIDKAALGGQAFNVAGQDFKYSTGRSTMATDVLENTINGYLSVIVRGQKNMVAQSVLRMVNNAGDPNFAVVNPIFSARQLDIDKLVEDKVFYSALSQSGNIADGRKALENYRNSLRTSGRTPLEVATDIQKDLDVAMYQGRITSKQHETLSKRLESVIEKNLELGADGYVKEVTQATTHKEEDALLAKVDGKPVIMKFMEGADGGEKFGTFISALKNSNSKDQALVLEWIAQANRFIGQLLTSKNLTWVPINWFRDMGTAYANASTDPRVGEKLARKIAKYSPRGYRVAINKLMQEEYVDKNGSVYRFFKRIFKTQLTQREETFWNEYVNSGAPVFFMDRKDIKEQIEEMQRELNPSGGLKGTWEAYGKFADFVGIPSEMSVRFSAYMHLREEGWTKDEAAVFAKELTVNFEQSGSSTWIKSLFMFANPAIQGNVRMVRDTFVNGKVNPKFLKAMTALMALGMIANFVARAASAEDDDEPDDLDTIARYKRATQVVLIPGMHFGSPIFLPYGWNVFYAVGQFLPDSLLFGTPASTTVDRIASTAVDAFWPLGQSESANFFGTVIKSITPTPIAPFMDIAMNESRFGGPISKSANPFVKAEEAASWSNFSSASPISTYLLRKLNEIGGGTQYKSGSILGINTDYNPDKLDYLLGGLLPGPISDTARLVNMTTNLAMGKDLKTTRLPLIDRFGSKGRDENPSWDAGAYRRATTFVETLYKDAQNAQGAHKEEILKEHPKLGNAKAALSAIDKNIRSLRTTLRAIESDTNRSMQEKVEARNQVQKLEQRYFADAVRIAMKTGFKDPILSD